MLSGMGDIEKMLSGFGMDGKEKKVTLGKKKQIEMLQDYLLDLKAPCMFRVGDVVTQKKDAGKYRFPSPGNPAIVLNLIENPKVSDGDRNDMVIGVVTPDNATRVYEVESIRFEMFN